jgi:two-component system response regulator RegX3
MGGRTLILDPDVVAAKLARFVLADAGLEVALVNTSAAAITEATDEGAHAVLTETELMGISGFQLCKELRGRGFRGPVIFVSKDLDAEARVRAFDCGADDFITKPYNPRELIARLESISRRCHSTDQVVLGNVLKVGDVELQICDLRLLIEGRRPIVLSPTEMRLLEGLMRNQSMTLTRDALIDRAWPHDFIADTNRVDVYIGRLRRKIERDPAHPEYIQTVRGLGYVFRPRRLAERMVVLRGEQGDGSEMIGAPLATLP